MPKQISMSEYYKGRDTAYSKELTATIKANAIHTVECTNKLLAMMAADDVDTSTVGCNSGWRPKSVNAATKGSAPNSPHIYALAIDLGDRSGKVKKWVSANPAKVLEAGFVAIEDFKITATWVHLQTRPKQPGEVGRVIWGALKDGWKNWATGVVKKLM